MGCQFAGAADDASCASPSSETFGSGHDEIGARLCESWCLAPAAVASVRHHVEIHATLRLPRVSHRYICVLSALADAITNAPDRLDEIVMKVAPQAMLDQGSLLRSLKRVKDKMDEARWPREERGRIDRGVPSGYAVQVPALLRCLLSHGSDRAGPVAWCSTHTFSKRYKERVQAS